MCSIIYSISCGKMNSSNDFCLSFRFGELFIIIYSICVEITQSLFFFPASDDMEAGEERDAPE